MSTEMTIEKRASAALTIDVTVDQLVAMAEETKDLVQIKDKVDYLLVKTSQLKLRDTRIKIERAGKDARDDANRFSKAVIKEERLLVGIISDEEERLKAMRKVVDEHEATIKREAAEKEAARIADVQEQVAAIYRLTEGLLNSGSDEIRNRIVSASSVVVTAFQEFEPAALLAKTTVIDSLTEALVAKVEQEELARVAEEQAEQMRELQEELDRKEADIRAREDELERQHLERKEAGLKKERERQAAIEEENRNLREDKRRRLLREEVEKESARQEKLRPERERLQAWGQMLKDIEPPKNIRTKLGKEVVAECLKTLGAMGNSVIQRGKEL